MYLIAGIGLLLVACSALMLFAPDGWERFWMRFSKKPYSHYTEIAIRAILAIILFTFAEGARHPLAVRIFGFVAASAVVTLLAMGETRHRQFARLVFERYGPAIRWGSLFGIVAGLWLFCTSVG
ncbi:MAG: hypothetical protein CBD18_01915 [Opitutales bacterium TMED158]|nr:MAG: hypothetical protein CBD18_01915 [Opitutales bacterium TMED158]